MSRPSKAQVQRWARARARKEAEWAQRRADGTAAFNAWAESVSLTVGPMRRTEAEPWVATKTPLPGGRVRVHIDGFGLGPGLEWVAPYDGAPYRPWRPKRMRRRA